MKGRLVLSALGMTLGLTACAGTAEGSLEPGRMRLTEMEIPNDPKVNFRYPALLRYEASGDVRIIDTCFTWIDEDSLLQRLDEATGLGDGPYCLVPEGTELPNTVKTMLVNGFPGDYRLVVYIRYEGGGEVRTTNEVSEPVIVTERFP